MQLSSIQIIALATLLVVIAGFLVFAVLLMLRVRKETELLRKEVLSQLNEISRVTRRYQHAEHDLGVMLERAKQFVSKFDAERLQALLETLNRKLQGPRMSPELMSLSEQGFAALGEVVETPNDQLIEWRENRRSDLSRLIQQKGRLEAELDALRLQVDDSNREIRALRAKSGELDSAQSAMEQLRQVNQRLSQDLRDTRRRAQEAESRLNPLAAEQERLRARLEAQQSGGGGPVSAEVEAENRNLRSRLRALENITDKLRKDAEHSEEELSRVLREKSFLEERFLESVE
jgi:predicted  nucleic acid-binding Zn-ribbon protein